jgi:endoglucanase
MDTSLLKTLSEAPGVSGDEAPVRAILRDAVKDHVDELRVDTMGNLIALKRAATAAPPLKVMLAAHMDEVGFMVTRIDKSGALRFRQVGGLDDRILLAKVVYVGKNRLPGVIGVKPVHLIDRGEDERVVKADELVIDIGASSQEEAERLVSLGDRAVFATAFEETSPAVKGKAFDDRVGCAVLAELVRERYPVELYAVWTVQEEIGARGARVAAYALEPDVAIALEGTICDELPKKKDLSPTTRMGAGPAITVMDRSLIADRRLVRLVIETAEAEGIPYQFKQPGLGGTDAGYIHLVRAGIPATAVSVPCRYIHAPAALMSPADFDNTVRLMKAALNKLSAFSKQTNDRRRTTGD